MELLKRLLPAASAAPTNMDRREYLTFKLVALYAAAAPSAVTNLVLDELLAQGRVNTTRLEAILAEVNTWVQQAGVANVYQVEAHLAQTENRPSRIPALGECLTDDDRRHRYEIIAALYREFRQAHYALRPWDPDEDALP